MSSSDVDIGSLPIAEGGDLEPVASDNATIIARPAKKRRASQHTKVRKSAAWPSVAKPVGRAHDTAAGVPIVVLSTDAELADAIRGAAQERHPLVIASKLEEAQQHAANGRCAVLITDQLSSQPVLRQTMSRLRALEPALVVIAVGNRGDENALASLLSADIVDRLMLKPVTPALAQILIKSAAQQFRTLKGPTAPAAAPVAQRQSGPRRVKLAGIAAKIATLPRPHWLTAVAAAAVAAAAVWSLMSQRLPDIDPHEVISKNLAAAQRAVDEGRLVDPAGRSAVDHYTAVLALDPANAAAQSAIAKIADRFVAEAERSLANGQLAAAIVALQGVRRVQPEHRRLPALDTRLRIEQEKYVLAFRTQQAAAAEREQAAAAMAVEAKQTPSAATAAVMKQTPAQTRADSGSAAREPPDAVALSLPVPELNKVSVAATPPPPINEEPAIAEAPAIVAPTTTPPSLVKFVRPHYPQDALISDLEGWVDVSLSVTPAGDVVDPRVEDSTNGRLFNRAALAAVRKWKYERRPADDPALAQRFTVRVAFQLDGRRGS